MGPDEIERAGNMYSALREFEENKEHYAIYIANIAWAKKKFYEACLTEGFSKEQALELTFDYNPFQTGA